MRWFRKHTNTCQNCINGNNKKGKRIYHWYHKGLGIGFDENDMMVEIPKEGRWYIFCEKKQKYYFWGKHKRCFKKK